MNIAQKKALKTASPTNDLYSWVTYCYNRFNEELFDNTLPTCMFTMQREKKVMGYFSANRWLNKNGKVTHEISLNPAYFASGSVIEIFQTLVHEMCHLWQEKFGKPSRSNYHNKEWADKMESIGLMPSDTGLVGGKKTGQAMSDYPIKGGLFYQACKKLAQSDINLVWVDRIPAITPSSQPRSIDLVELDTQELEEVNEFLATNVIDLIPGIEPVESVASVKKAKQKVKYSCSGCNANVWGKPNLNIHCNDCKIDYITEVSNG